MLISEIEIITDGGRRRRWTAAEKLRIVEETLDDRPSISVVALQWRGSEPVVSLAPAHARRGSVAVSEDDDVTSNKVVRQMEDCIRKLERQLGRKSLEAEVLREALDKSRSRKPTLLARSPLKDDFR